MNIYLGNLLLNFSWDWLVLEISFFTLQRRVCYINGYAQIFSGYEWEFFKWCDDPKCDRYVKIINGLLFRLNRKEDKKKEEEEKKQIKKRFNIIVTILVATWVYGTFMFNVSLDINEWKDMLSILLV